VRLKPMAACKMHKRALKSPGDLVAADDLPYPLNSKDLRVWDIGDNFTPA